MFTTKTNSFEVNPVSGRSRSSGFVSWSAYSQPGVACSESISGSGHYRTRGHWSGGGPMSLNRNITTFSVGPLDYQKLSGTSQIDGTIRMGSNLSASATIATYVTPSDSQMNADGTTAIARILPTNPAFDLSTFLGELRAEGLPNFPNFVTREKVLRAKSAGNRYLEYEFGWAPLVRGIRDFADVVVRSDDIVRSYQEHANISFDRRYEFPEVSESHAEPMNFGSIPGNGGQWTGGGRHQHAFQRKWFEAEFTYYLPTGGTVNDKFRRYGSYARKLFGIDLTPEVLWNLSPWSWAADWFANTGDVLHNISSIGVDGLVMRHAYMMCHTSKVISDHGKHTATGAQCTRVNTVESKRRMPGTPYGFGLLYDGLTTKQKAIIAALGISRW